MSKETKNIKLTINFENDDYWDVLSLCPIGPLAEQEIKEQSLTPEFSYDLFREPLVFGFEYEFNFMRPEASPVFTIEEDGQVIEKFIVKNIGCGSDTSQKEDKQEEKMFQQYLREPKADDFFWFEEDVIKEGIKEPHKDGKDVRLLKMFRNTIRHASSNKALLVYFRNASLGELSFDIKIPSDSTFNSDIIKLFYWVGRPIKNISPCLRALLKKDLILLNAIRYEGKLYFSEDCLWMDEESLSFEYVDETLKLTSI